jgi:hypothetical protein
VVGALLRCPVAGVGLLPLAGGIVVGALRECALALDLLKSEKNGGLFTACKRPERGRAMAVGAGRGH